MCKKQDQKLKFEELKIVFYGKCLRMKDDTKRSKDKGRTYNKIIYL